MFCQIVASADREELSIVNNLYRALSVVDRLNRLGVHFVCCEGHYGGNVENSFLIDVETLVMFDVLKAVFLGTYNQDCILVLRGVVASLYYKNGHTAALGTWHEVCRTRAERDNGAYTLIRGKYFICDETTEAPVWGECSDITKEAESEALHDKDAPWKCKEEHQLLADVEI
jgi:hypothetical protein